MNKKPGKSFLLNLIFFVVAALCFACSAEKEVTNTAPVPANQSSSRPAANNNSAVNKASEVPAGAVGFSTANVCSLPSELSKDSPFAGLGGGMWEKWDDSDNELSYSCEGGKDSIKLEDVTAKISAGYSALGDETTVRVVSATYMALQYGGETPVEKPLRQKYYDLCENLSRKLVGQMLPDKFKKRLMDEAGYSATGADDEYTEKVEKGFLSLATRRDKTDLIRLEVSYFPSEAEFRKFKESK